MAAEELQAGTKFEGRWSGSGWEFDLTFTVDKVGANDAEGHSDWVLRGVPDQHSADYGPKIGNSAVEKWKGECTGRAVRVKGFETKDPAEIIAAGEYQLVLRHSDDLYKSESDDEEDVIEREKFRRAQVAMGKVSGSGVRLIRWDRSVMPNDLALCCSASL